MSLKTKQARLYNPGRKPGGTRPKKRPNYNKESLESNPYIYMSLFATNETKRVRRSRELSGNSQNKSTSKNHRIEKIDTFETASNSSSKRRGYSGGEVRGRSHRFKHKTPKTQKREILEMDKMKEFYSDFHQLKLPKPSNPNPKRSRSRLYLQKNHRNPKSGKTQKKRTRVIKQLRKGRILSRISDQKMEAIRKAREQKKLISGLSKIAKLSIENDNRIKRNYVWNEKRGLKAKRIRKLKLLERMENREKSGKRRVIGDHRVDYRGERRGNRTGRKDTKSLKLTKRSRELTPTYASHNSQSKSLMLENAVDYLEDSIQGDFVYKFQRVGESGEKSSKLEKSRESGGHEVLGAEESGAIIEEDDEGASKGVLPSSETRLMDSRSKIPDNPKIAKNPKNGVFRVAVNPMTPKPYSAKPQKGEGSFSRDEYSVSVKRVKKLIGGKENSFMGARAKTRASKVSLWSRRSGKSYKSQRFRSLKTAPNPKYSHVKSKYLSVIGGEKRTQNAIDLMNDYEYLKNLQKVDQRNFENLQFLKHIHEPQASEMKKKRRLVRKKIQDRLQIEKKKQEKVKRALLRRRRKRRNYKDKRVSKSLGGASVSAKPAKGPQPPKFGKKKGILGSTGGRSGNPILANRAASKDANQPNMAKGGGEVAVNKKILKKRSRFSPKGKNTNFRKNGKNKGKIRSAKPRVGAKGSRKAPKKKNLRIKFRKKKKVNFDLRSGEEVQSSTSRDRKGPGDTSDELKTGGNNQFDEIGLDDQKIDSEPEKEKNDKNEEKNSLKEPENDKKRSEKDFDDWEDIGGEENQKTDFMDFDEFEGKPDPKKDSSGQAADDFESMFDEIGEEIKDSASNSKVKKNGSEDDLLDSINGSEVDFEDIDFDGSEKAQKQPESEKKEKNSFDNLGEFSELDQSIKSSKSKDNGAEDLNDPQMKLNSEEISLNEGIEAESIKSDFGELKLGSEKSKDSGVLLDPVSDQEGKEDPFEDLGLSHEGKKAEKEEKVESPKKTDESHKKFVFKGNTNNLNMGAGPGKRKSGYTFKKNYSNMFKKNSKIGPKKPIFSNKKLDSVGQETPEKPKSPTEDVKQPESANKGDNKALEDFLNLDDNDVLNELGAENGDKKGANEDKNPDEELYLPFEEDDKAKNEEIDNSGKNAKNDLLELPSFSDDGGDDNNSKKGQKTVKLGSKKPINLNDLRQKNKPENKLLDILGEDDGDKKGGNSSDKKNDAEIDLLFEEDEYKKNIGDPKKQSFTELLGFNNDPEHPKNELLDPKKGTQSSLFSNGSKKSQKLKKEEIPEIEEKPLKTDPEGENVNLETQQKSKNGSEFDLDDPWGDEADAKEDKSEKPKMETGGQEPVKEKEVDDLFGFGDDDDDF